ncbi:MAG: hypothetical protein KAS71_05735, partial [Bacteroidales bacterium]|nr:hypothetical protein [Bacteroidales bacterium]
MRISEVVSRKARNNFHKTAKLIYKGNNTWVCPLDIEIEAIFDPNKNTFFKHGEAIRWILYDS